MQHHSDLLQAVLDAPDDDTPRLIYADWLEEHNQPERANFIRVQCELARTSQYHPDTRARWTELKQIEQSLWDSNKSPWLRELPDISGFWWDTPFERGFVSRCKPDNANVLVDQSDVWLNMPVCRGVRLTNASGLERLVQSPCLAEVRHLDVECWIGDTGVSMLARSPFVRQLKTFQLNNCRVSPAVVAMLTRSPHLSHLQRLELRGNPIHNGGAVELANTPFLDQLRVLDLRNTQMNAHGLCELAQSPLVQRLEILRLSYNPLGDSGIAELASSPMTTNLILLSIDHTGLTPHGAELLLESPYFSANLTVQIEQPNELSPTLYAEFAKRFHCRD